MAQSSESLLQMISNLKISAVANDTADMNHRIDQRTEELKGAENGNRSKLLLAFIFFPLFPVLLADTNGNSAQSECRRWLH
jgi:hypothetical protein